MISSRLPIDGQESGGLNQSWAAQRTGVGWTREYVALPARRASYDSNQFTLSYTADFRASLWGTTGAFGVDPSDPTQIVTPASPGFAPTALSVLRRNADRSINEQLRGPSPDGGGQPVTAGTVSADGRTSTFALAQARLVDSDPSYAGIYQRTDSELPRLVSVDEQGNSVPTGQLLAVSDDARRVLFSDQAGASGRLWTAATGRSIVVPGLNNDGRYGYVDPSVDHAVFVQFGGLVRFDSASGTSSTLATSDTPNVLAGSPDGSVYFSTVDALPGTLGAQQGETNIYRLAAGADQPTFVAAAPANEFVQGRALADGALLFATPGSIGGQGVSGVRSLFRWAPDGGPVRCLSCPATGQPAAADTVLDSAAEIADYPTRYGTDDGRYVYFNTPQRLARADTNSVNDVYEVDVQTGEPSLITPGDGASDSYFLGVGASGRDVFFATRQRLVRSDQNGEVFRVYDARIGGGFPEATGPAACSGDDCRNPAPDSIPAPAAATVSFSGPGNVAAPRASVAVAAIRGAVRGSRFSLRVRAPGRGTIRATGTRLLPVSRKVSRAAAYRVTIRLSATGRRLLARKRSLRVRVKVRFSPLRGATSSASVPVTLRRP